MEEKNCTKLFAYLKDILYDTSNASLDLSTLDEPYQQLGQGLQCLQSIVAEMLDYSAELSKGNLSVQVPAKDNLLCTNLKNMQATLNHMTWQAKQVAAGDYSQQVSYLGEFSDAFNTMTTQLKEREEQLLRETENLKRRSESVVVYNELLAKMMENRIEWILVVDAETQEVVYCNQGTHHMTPQLGVSPCASCGQCKPGREELLPWSDTEQRSWLIHLKDDTSLRVMSYILEWQGRNSYVHVVSDVTAMELEKRKLSNKAYFDALTGIYNRAYFQERIEKLLREHQSFTLGYLDMDGLKFVNDHFGHNEGDRYIRRFVTKVLENFRSDDVFARVGGDEFCVILQGELYDLTCSKLERVREKLVKADSPYPMSFSYGVFEVKSVDQNVTLNGILQQADQRMYKYKRENKMQRTL